MPTRALFFLSWMLGVLAGSSAQVPSPEESAAELPPEPGAGALDLAPHAWRLVSEDLDLRAGGRLVLDGIHYGRHNARSNGLEVDTATAVFEGNVGSHLGFHVEADLLGVDTRDHLFEAFAGLRVSPQLRVRAGQMRFALGSEFATDPRNGTAPGYSYPPSLDARHDAGVLVDGDLLEGTLWYEAGYAAGTGFDPEGRRKESAQLQERLVLLPFAPTPLAFARDLFVGFGAAHGRTYKDLIEVATPVENTVFESARLDAGPTLWLHAEAGFHWRFVGIAFEQVHGRVRDVPGSGGTRDLDSLRAYSVSTSVFLNGAAPSWASGRWQPVSFHEALGLIPSTGPVELAVRYSRASLDRELFQQGLADPQASARVAETLATTLTWYYHPRVRPSFSYVETLTDHGLEVFGGSRHDRTFVLRLDLRF